MRHSVFPGDTAIAAVSGWDGGSAYDIRLAAVLDQYGWKGTFFMQPETLGQEGFLAENDLQTIVGGGHEIGLFSPEWPHLVAQGPAACVHRLRAERTKLEALIGKPVTSFAYPAGFMEDMAWIAEAVREAGFNSARTTQEANLQASHITDWLRLPVTASALHDHMGLRERWEAVEETGEGIFYLWGCSAEYGDDDDKWAELECNLAWFCGRLDVWYCTQAELFAHLRNG
jgi:peptidoglycan/xylan/chitin deacetylase (PgdA/CDA1 family)